MGSNFQPLRDAATIGLVKLTEDHIDILIRLLEIFEKVNDDYIIERLIAAGWWC
ncbi:MAG: hypothetical protein IPG79_03340 [Saprospiraceae bacterium]|nr:hypothetical protein [Saprospiraceae bacterium]